MRGIVREAAQPERLGRERDVLDHQALLEAAELEQVRLDLVDRADAAGVDVVVQVTALRAAEPLDTRRARQPVLVVMEEVRELLAQRGEQDRQVQRRHLGHRDEVGRARDVGRPLVERRRERQLARDLGAAVAQRDPHPPIGLGEAPFAAERDERLVVRGREVLGPGQDVRPLVVDQEQGHGRHRVGARLGPPDHAHHDLAATRLGAGVRAVRQLPVHLARDPGRGEGEDGLLVDGQRDRAAWRSGTPARCRTGRCRGRTVDSCG